MPTVTINRMTVPHNASQRASRLGETAYRVAELIDRVTDSFDGRNRAFDEALDVPEREPLGREYPGPEAGCGHVRLIT